MEIRFFVPGIPKPGGSKIAQPVRRKGGAIVMYKDARGNDTPLITVRDASNNVDWKNAVRIAGRAAMRMNQDLLTGPLQITVYFYMPRLKAHFRANGELKPNAPVYHTVQPDALKLMRSTEDALTGVVWRDDAGNARHEITKVYGDRCGADIVIQEIGRPAGVG